MPPADDSARDNVILCVGAIQSRKNTARLVTAFEQIVPKWKLVLAGSMGYGGQEILARIQRSPRRADIELRGYVTNTELEALYRRARIFAFPSLDEGFGMPVLDAMARGVPVLTSSRSATLETAGDAALLIDPEDVSSIAGGLQELAAGAHLRDEYRRRGFSRSAGFKWEDAVEKTWQVYRELL